MKAGLEQDLKMAKDTRQFYRDKISELEKKVKLLERDLLENKILRDVKKKVQKILEAGAKKPVAKPAKKSSKRSKKD